MSDFKSFEKINPVVSSAGYSLSALAAAGVPEAVKLHKEIVKNFPDTAERTFSADKATDTAEIINAEFRYKAINRAIEKTGIRNVLDLGCGFSPRPAALAAAGYNILGADLPAIIARIKPAAAAMDSTLQGISYMEVDATNAASLSDAADSLGDELIIVTEGLLPYFTESELWTVIENIRTVLLRHGGVWITPDFNETENTRAGFGAVCGQDALSDFSNVRSDKIRDLFGEQFVVQDMVPVEMLGTDILSELHLKEEKMPLYDGSINIESLSMVSEEIAEACRDAYSGVCLSVIAEDDTTTAMDRLAALFTTPDGTLSIRHEIINGILKITLDGRLDSLTSPKLLDFYEEELNKKSFRMVHLDFSNLDYISSAGLRVLLIMYKGTPMHKVKLLNVGTDVFSVLEMTGYADIFGL